MISMKEIEKELATAAFENFESVCEKYREDPRSGVAKLIEKYEKKWDKYQKELDRLVVMTEYERNAKIRYGENVIICGIDEAGRGPLAGPVVAAAVILPEDIDAFMYVNDSKQLSEAKREALYDVIMEHALGVGVGIASPERIDEINILQATYEAMRQAISTLPMEPSVTLNDAVKIPKIAQTQIPIIKGDAKSLSIAAASIIAKVTRDRLMRAYDELYPEYGFAGHKGYGSAAHIEALKSFGPCPIHRKTFITHFV